MHCYQGLAPFSSPEVLGSGTAVNVPVNVPFFKLKISQWVMFWLCVEFRDKREEFHSWISPSLDTYLKWDVSILPPPHPLSRSFWLLQKTVVPPHLHSSAALPHSHLHFCLLALFHIFQFILSHLLFICFVFFLFSPVFLFPPSLWQRTTSSKCTARHELSTCFGRFLLAWKSAIIHFFKHHLITTQGDIKLLTRHNMSEPVPLLVDMSW